MHAFNLKSVIISTIYVLLDALNEFILIYSNVCLFCVKTFNYFEKEIKVYFKYSSKAEQ